MTLVENWLPPSRENWDLVVSLFALFPVVTLIQWVIPWYGAGKTSADSKFNIPGKIAWLTMEVPGFMTLLYVMNTITKDGIAGLPWKTRLWEEYSHSTTCTVRYSIQSLLRLCLPYTRLFGFPAILFQVMNGMSIGGWLGGYGPTTRAEWLIHGSNFKVGGRMEFGLMIWALASSETYGMMKNCARFAEHQREIKPGEQKEAEESTGKGKAKINVDKVYLVPENGLFRLVLYPHYFCEWIEWFGFWCMAGLGCVPARNFLLNEITTMLPRAVSGKEWYIKRFGAEKIGSRKAVIPGIL